jgi:hypothetical protein
MLRHHPKDVVSEIRVLAQAEAAFVPPPPQKSPAKKAKPTADKPARKTPTKKAPTPKKKMAA